MQATNPSYNPDALNMSKAEILGYLQLVVLRWKNNPKVHKAMVKKFQADLILMKHFVKEEDLRYHWGLFRELVDGLYAINARKKAPELQRMNEMHKEAFIKKLAIPPEVKSEFDAMKIIAAARKQLSFGSMKNGI